MPAAKLFNMQGADQGTVDLPDAIFAVEPNAALVHEAVIGFLANKRQGTHKTKVRKEVRGGGAKPFRQKGTGRARQGSSREPHMRGGGAVFGPKPRSYRKAVPVRVRRHALCCVLSERVRDDRLAVLAEFACGQPKTKPMAEMLGKVSPEAKKTLVVTAGHEPNFVKSTRNIPGVIVRTVADVNALDAMNANRIVLQQEALKPLQERLS